MRNGTNMRRTRNSVDRPWTGGRRRENRAATTAVYPQAELPVSPRPMTGMRRAQLMDTYVRLLEMTVHLGVRADTGVGDRRRWARAVRLCRIVARRLGRG